MPPGLVRYLHGEFSAEIERGCTYPMEQAMTLEKFRDYWFGTFAVVALIEEEEDAGKIGLHSREWEKVCLGTFYIKPNYPGEFCLVFFCCFQSNNMLQAAARMSATPGF